MTTQTGACAKVRVKCTLVHPDGRQWIGYNDVANPQQDCPRGQRPSGEGYELCRDVCGQMGHAEEQALRVAGEDAAGCTAYVENIHYICMNCQVKLKAAGVVAMVLGAPTTQREADERAQINAELQQQEDDHASMIKHRMQARAAIDQSTRQAAPIDDEPTMLWLHDDNEVFANGPDDFAEDYACNCLRPGEEAEVRVDCAYRGSTRTMRIAMVENGDDDKVVWKWSDEAAATDQPSAGQVDAPGADELHVLRMKAEAWDEWQRKTEWVQEQISSFPISSLGRHRADVMRTEIERLRTVDRSYSREEVQKWRNDVAHAAADIVERAAPSFGDGDWSWLTDAIRALAKNPQTERLARASLTPTAPIDMILHCPKCGQQHIDAPDARKAPAFGPGMDVEPWTNPPHRSHLCHGCGHIWRPADVPTNGVKAIQTKGSNDTPTAPQAASQQAGANFRNARTTVTPGFIIRDFDPPAGLVTTAASLDDVAPAAPQAATTASASTIKTWRERAIELGSAALDPKTAYGLLQAEIDDLRAALARAPLPAHGLAQPGRWNVLTEDDKPDASRLIDVILANGVCLMDRQYSKIDWSAVRDWRYSAVQAVDVARDAAQPLNPHTDQPEGGV